MMWLIYTYTESEIVAFVSFLRHDFAINYLFYNVRRNILLCFAIMLYGIFQCSQHLIVRQ